MAICAQARLSLAATATGRPLAWPSILKLAAAMASAPYTGFYIGSYATAPKKAPELEDEYYSGLAALAECAGLELGLTISGGVDANHNSGEEQLLAMLRRHGVPRKWSYVLTLVTSTMAAIDKDPHFGLASGDERGRRAAVEMGRLACSAVSRLNAVAGDGAVRFVELQSGPSVLAKAAAAGVSSSAAALARSLRDLAELDWQGARLVLEHCDAHDGVAPVKGLLPLAAELEALQEANAGQPASRRVLLTVNWARSVLETQDTTTAATHVAQARSAGLLGGIMFSGCSGVDGPYGQWKDTHMPHAKEGDVAHYAEGSLLTSAEMRRCFASAEGPGSFAYVGAKITCRTAGERNVAARVGINGAMLQVLSAAAGAGAAGEERPAAAAAAAPKKRPASALE